jgi:hypothetical protein
MATLYERPTSNTYTTSWDITKTEEPRAWWVENELPLRPS